MLDTRHLSHVIRVFRENPSEEKNEREHHDRNVRDKDGDDDGVIRYTRSRRARAYLFCIHIRADRVVEAIKVSSRRSLRSSECTGADLQFTLSHGR